MSTEKSAARKKARWSAAQKADARKGRRAVGATGRRGVAPERAPRPRAWRPETDEFVDRPRRRDERPGTSAAGRPGARGARPQTDGRRDERRSRWVDERPGGDRPERAAGAARQSAADRPRRGQHQDSRSRGTYGDRGAWQDTRPGRRGAVGRDPQEYRSSRDERRRYGGDDGRRPCAPAEDRRRYGRDDREAGRGDRSGDRRAWTDGRGYGGAQRGDGRERPGREVRERPGREVRERPDRDFRERPGRDFRERPSREVRSERERARRGDPHAERMRRAEHSRRDAPDRGPVSDPAVAADNGFAALGLPDVLVRRLARDGITQPFPIQEATIPDALAGRDVLGRGRTGSGKTLAFGLPTLARLAADGPAAPNRPAALVLVPTRELAMQVSDALEPLAHVAGVRHKLVAGGLAYAGQIAALDRGVDLLIATPGRLIDLVDRGAVALDSVRYAVLDEADHMAEMGFLPDVTALLDLIPAGGQRLLFSATLDKGIDELVARYLTDPVEHATDAATASVTTMAHHVLLVEPAHKKLITAQVANRAGRTIVFVRTKLGADRVAREIREQGVLAAALHGGLNQGARNRVLAAFKDGRMPVLVATDVAARGIHVDEVSVVLQVDPPADPKDYLHRAGRTARAGEQGGS